MFSNGVKAMGGRHNHDKFPVHYRKNEGCKFIGKPGTISIDYCDKCLRIHDGCTPGGCFKICAEQEGVVIPPEPITADQVCVALQGAPELGDVEVEASPAAICATLNNSPVLGEVEVTATGGDSTALDCSGEVIGTLP